MQKNTMYVATVAIIALLGGFIYCTSMQNNHPQEVSFFEKNTKCASFNTQASERIRSYYVSPDDHTKYTPDEIFYSSRRDTCIAAWKHIELHEKGTHTQWVIFDALTNEEEHSSWNFMFYDEKDAERNGKMDVEKDLCFEEKIEWLKGNIDTTYDSYEFYRCEIK